MYSASSEISIILNVINSNPNEYITISPRTYQRHFHVLDCKRIRNIAGDVSLIQVKKEEALKLLKDKYRFFTQSEITKELQDARSNI